MVSQAISVIIPAHNAADCLTAAIDSALDQTWPAAEILVADDASTDTTAAIAAAYGPPVRCLQREPAPHPSAVVRAEPLGPAAARNLAIGAARGVWLAFLDADDRWPQHHLEAVGQLAQTSAADLVFTDARIISAAGGNESWLRHVGHDWLLSLPAAQQARLECPFELLIRHGSFLLPSSVLVRRDAVVDAGGFDETLPIGVEDLDLWLRLAPHMVWAYAATSRVERREYGANLSRNRRRMAAGAEQVWRKALRPESLAGLPLTVRPELESQMRRHLAQARHNRVYWFRYEHGLCADRLLRWLQPRTRRPA